MCSLYSWTARDCRHNLTLCICSFSANMAALKEEGVGLTLATHIDGIVSLCRDGHKYYVRHRLTSEVSMVDGVGEVCLSFNDEGYAYVTDSTGESTWVDDVLNIGVYNGPDGHVYEVPDIPALTHIEFASFGELQTAIKFQSGPHLEKELRVAWHLKSRGGCHVFWDLSSWYSSCGLDAFGSDGRWASHGWVRWVAKVQNYYGLCALSCKKALRSNEEENVGDKLDVRAVSSLAFASLVVTWAYAPKHQGGLEGDTNRESLNYTFMGLLQAACGGVEQSCSIFEGEGVVVDEFGFGQGALGHIVILHDGIVDVSKLLSGATKFSHALNKKLGGRTSWPLRALLERRCPQL